MARPRTIREPVAQPQDQSIKLVPLTHGQVAIVDAFKYEWAMLTTWGAKWDEQIKGYYARAKIGYMHRLLLSPNDPKLHVDHKNGCTLDNRLENLRIVTETESSQNRKVRRDCQSGYTGIYWIQKRRKWRVEITVYKKTIHVGEFTRWDNALAARLDAERKYFGEYALSARSRHQKTPTFNSPLTVM